MTQRASTVVAVVVAYRPEPERLQACLSSLQPQVAAVELVHNGEACDWPSSMTLTAPVVLTHLGGNLGLARAQNIGMTQARQRGATHVLLIDQDSLAEPGMVAALLDALTRPTLTTAAERSCAAAGPLILQSGQPTGFVHYRSGRYRTVQPPHHVRIVECDLLIASGMLIPLPALDAIGPMEEQLFIDKIDTEWCLRAASRGWRVMGVPGARLHHQIGSGRIKPFFWSSREIPIHAPERYRWMTRNSLWLCRRAEVPWSWALADLVQLLLLAVVLSWRHPRACEVRASLRQGWREGWIPPRGGE